METQNASQEFEPVVAGFPSLMLMALGVTSFPVGLGTAFAGFAVYLVTGQEVHIQVGWAGLLIVVAGTLLCLVGYYSMKVRRDDGMSSLERVMLNNTE